MLYSNSFLHVIVKTTRTTACTVTLIDHIHTHTTADLNSGSGVIADISDHLPIFCIIDITVNRSRNTIQLRDCLILVKNYTGMIFVQLTGMLLSVRTPNITDLTNSITGAVKVVIDKHVPINS